MRNLVNSFLTFIVNAIFQSSYSSVFLKIVIQVQVYLGGISSKAVVNCMSAVLLEAGSFVGVSQLFCLFYYFLCERLFSVTALSSCFVILNTFFILILHGKKVSTRALFVGEFLIIIWYCISCLFDINAALAIQRGFLYR